MALNPGGVRYIGSSTGSTPITKPTLTVQGDLMILGAFGSSQPSASGFATIWSGIVGTGYGLIAYKVHGDEAATTSYTVTNSSYSWFSTYRGADVNSPIGAWSYTAESGDTTPTATGITTGTPRSMIHGIITAESSPTFTPPSGMTETPSSDTSGGETCYVIQAEPGASGDKTWTASASGSFVMWLIEIREGQTSRRLYFDSAAAAPLAPSTWCAQWDLPADKSALPSKKLNDTRGSSAQSWRTYTDASSTNNQDSVLARFVVMLGTGYIQGGFLAVLQSYEGNTLANCFSQISIKIIQPGGTDRAVLYAGQTNTGTSGSEFSATAQANATNRYFPKATLSRAMTAAWAYEGDALVVEIGYRQNSTSTTYIAGMYIGEPSGTDLTDANETETTDNTPWIEFPWGLTLQGEGPDMREDVGPYMRRIE
jgi:hypothetical protein